MSKRCKFESVKLSFFSSIFMNRICIILCVFCLFSCKENTVTWEEKHKSQEFGEVVSLDTYPVALSALMDIEDWDIVDTTLICKNSGKNPYYYVLSSTDFDVIGKFGRNGKGENEWMSPHLLVKNDTMFSVIDNIRWGIYDVAKKDSSYSIQKKTDLNVQTPLNAVKPISCSHFAYVTHSPKEVSWKIGALAGDLSTVDSILVYNGESKDNSMLYDFSYDVGADYAVFAFLHLDRLMISSISDSLRVVPKCLLLGDGENRTHADVYYTDVICREYVYLLSQREVKTSETSGTSAIEVYDYEGNSIKKIVLDIIASNMLYDEINKKVILRTPMDNDLHILEYEFR